MKASSAFETLCSRMRDVGNLRMASAVLEWDQEVCMPPKGAAARGRQLATLNAHAHTLFTAAEMGTLIQEAQEHGDALTTDEQSLLGEIAYDYERAARIPESLIRRFSEARSAAYHAWLSARKQSDFAAFLPHLETLVALSKEEAECLGYQETPYDALLENYERGMTASQLRPIFERLAGCQSELVARVADAPQPDTDWLRQTWNTDRQWVFTEQVLRSMGYDFEAGRQDKSAHPFTTNFSIRDVRITTRLSADDFFSALFGSIHEGGHALYEQGFPETDEGTVLASAPSLGMHESQSRLWENVIGRSLPFWRHFLPELRTLFPGQLDRVEACDLYRAANRVAPSLIRVEADECTYNLHIILRFEIEAGLIENSLAAKDVPAIWNEKMKQYLGLEVPDDARGCLQDIHWSHGAFGYFPTYALGNLYAAQLFEVMQRDLPDVWEQVGQGAFGGVLSWLRSHIHCVGRRKTAASLIEKVTGAPPSPEAFLAYLKTKYGSLYNLD